MMTERELRRFLEEPGAHLILNPDLTIHTVGQEFSRVTRLPRDAQGKSIFQVYAGPEEGVQEVLDSLTRVKRTGDPDKMDMEILCVHIGEEDEERYLRITNIPVFDENDVLCYIVHRIEDFSQFWEARKEHSKLKRFTAVLFMVTVALMGVITLAYSHTTDQLHSQSRRLHDDERITCYVQQRALPAQRNLSSAMRDISTILAFPPSPNNKAAFHQLPKVVQKQELKVVSDLRQNLNSFYILTAKQPATRTC